MTEQAPIEVKSLTSRDPLAPAWLGRELVERFLIFDAFVGGERRVDLHPLVLSPALHRGAIEAATSVARLIGKVAARAHDDPAERQRYGLHEDVERLAAASFQAGDDAALVRVDLLLGDDGVFRACEINADCPGGHNEATGLPILAQQAGFWQGLNPTALLDDLVERLAALAERPGAPKGLGGRGTVALLYATAYAEDLQVCALVQRALRARGVPAILCAPTAPKLRGGVLCVGEVPVAVLYRYFPTEYMEGQRNLEMLATAVTSGALRTLSSFAQIYAQSKLAFARAWAKKTELTDAEQDVLARHTPETFELHEIPAAQLVAERAGWVLKRALGRVGDEVFVGSLMLPADWAALVESLGALCQSDETEKWLAQRFIPQRAVRSPYGEQLVTLGVYLLDGRFAGYFARLSTYSHVSHGALCVPVFTRVEGS